MVQKTGSHEGMPQSPLAPVTLAARAWEREREGMGTSPANANESTGRVEHAQGSPQDRHTGQGLRPKPKSVRDLARMLPRQNSLSASSFCKVVQSAQKMKLYSKEALGASRSSFGSESNGSESFSGNSWRRHKQRRASATDLQSELRQRMFGARHGAYAHSDVAARLLARRAQGERLTRRERLFLFLEEPGASQASFWVGGAAYAVVATPLSLPAPHPMVTAYILSDHSRSPRPRALSNGRILAGWHLALVVTAPLCCAHHPREH